MYRPSPIDNSHVELSPELTALIEVLARNNHELWARRRMSEGWRYGPNRSDPKKETPYLAPYDDLPESEKDYDRDNAIETLKTILALGGTIQAPKSAPEPADRSLPTLLATWGEHAPHQLGLAQYQELAARANALGECLVACDIADEGLKSWGGDKRLIQVRALALARMGSHEQAREVLNQLGDAAQSDEETLGLLARTYKDLWLKSGEAKDLEQAYRAYDDAYRSSPERYWTGINAATLAFARRDMPAASTIAASVRKTCLEKLESAAEDYWLISTIAEASLVLEDFPEAERWYAKAASIGQVDLGNFAATWRNARIILKFMPPDIAMRIERSVHMPKVAVFTGHRVDEPGRSRPRFPKEAAAAVGAAIKARLIEMNIRVGYASAACGSDILFLEAMQAVGGRTHIVLPCNQEQFIQESVATWDGEWVDRFHRVMGSADEMLIASDERLTVGSIAYDYANEILHGLASVRAGQLETELVRLAVWDGRPGDGPSGTADVVTRWRKGGHSVSVINPQELEPLAASAEPVTAAFPPPARIPLAAPDLPGFGSEIRAMIFADAYHFSKLSEDQIPAFIKDFIGPIVVQLEQARRSPIFQNTWGDGLFFVFENAGDAGRFALKLAERVAAIDRKAAGLPETISLRIALHVGPVYQFHDQIIGKQNFIGSHVNRTARIEPVTPPSQVYGSYAFVAIAALDAPGQFRCDYVGRVPLAKGFGEFPMYRVQAA